MPSEENHSFLFADLAGFTALTEAHGDRAAAEIAEQFVGSVKSLLPGERAQVVKTIGDEVMVRTETAADAVELGRRIVGELARHRSPPVRVGVHSGPALCIEGDWFGATVNVASRVAKAARPGEVLVTAATRTELGPRLSNDLVVRGERRFKGVRDPVSLFTAARVGGPGHELEIDPVCRMAVDPAKAVATRRRRRRDHHFCSAACVSAFDRDPGSYVVGGPGAQAEWRAFRTHLRIFIVVQIALVAVWVGALALGGSSWPWFLLFAAGWAVALTFHYRAVRSLP